MKQIAYLFACFMLLIPLACQKQVPLSIPEEKLVDVMTDMFMAEASMQRLTKKVKDTLSITYYEQIYEIHDLTKEEYLANLKVLKDHPKLAKKVYDAALAKVAKLENED